MSESFARIGGALALLVACEPLAAAVSPLRARACSFADDEPAEYVVDHASPDTDPPSRFEQPSAFVYRRVHRVCRGDTCTEAVGCNDFAEIDFSYRPPTDAETPDTDLGYRIVWLSGAIPSSIRGDLERVRPLPAKLYLKLDVNDAPGLDATIALVAVDRAGNESALSDPIVLHDSGCSKFLGGEECLERPSGGGCQSAPTGAAFSWLVAPLAMLTLGRRRRRHSKG